VTMNVHLGGIIRRKPALTHRRHAGVGEFAEKNRFDWRCTVLCTYDYTMLIISLVCMIIMVALWN